MAKACQTDRKDWAGRKTTALLIWGVPQAAFLLGCFVSPLFRTFLWTASLTVAGAACLVNAYRCGRMHCYFTGPFFLFGAVATLLFGLGTLPLGPHGWVWIGATAVAGGCILSFLPERLWGKYSSRC